MEPDAFLAHNAPAAGITIEDLRAAKDAMEKAYEVDMAERLSRGRRARAFLLSVPVAARDSAAVAVKYGLIAEGFVVHPDTAKDLERKVAEAIAAATAGSPGPPSDAV